MTFPSPVTINISGASSSGKSWFTYRMLKWKDEMFSLPLKKCLYCYGIWQPLFNEMESTLNIEFHKGLPSELTLQNFAGDTTEHNVVVLDDLMSQISKSSDIESLFVRGSHHLKLSVVYLNQNMFSQGKNARSVSLNSQILVLFRNPRGLSQVEVLSRQTGFGKSLIESFKDATSKQYGYLLIDLTTSCEEKKRLRTSIFPDEYTIVYVPS